MTSTNDIKQASSLRNKRYLALGHAKMEVDFFNSRYFMINKSLLRFMGLWPYQNKLAKIVLRISFSILATIFVIPQFICIFKTKDNPDRVIQAIATLCYLLGVSLKYALYIITEKKIKILYVSIVENWKLLKNQNERNILLESSDTGRWLTIGYVSYMISALTIFITLPTLAPALDMISPLANGSRPKIFILDGDYFVDKLEYYKAIYLFEGFTCTLTVFIFCTIDSNYAVTVEQCVGLLAVVKLRIKLATKCANQSKSLDYKAKDAAYEGLANAAKLHIHVLKFAQVLESSYSTAFLVVMMCNVAVLSSGSVVILIYLDNPMELIRYLLIYLGLMIHMFYLSWPGQKLIDSSSNIFYDAFNNNWYECSIKCQNLLKFMMLRSIEPLQLTCGGFYTMSLENYGALTKTSMSYITVFASFR